MSKTGRNDPCPCGSGKKYKKCHMSLNDEKQKEDSIISELEQLSNKNNSIQLLTLVGALQLYPANHFRYIRLEKIAQDAILNYEPADSKPLATWGQLKSAVENYTMGAEREDPVSNAFTEIAFFEEGNYIVYPGSFNNIVRLLNNLSECIFLTKNSLSTEFVTNVRDATLLMLHISDSVAREVGHESYIYEKEVSSRIVFPSHEQAESWSRAITFPEAYIRELCESKNINYEILHNFTIQPKSKDNVKEYFEGSIVVFRPLIRTPDGVALYMPSTVVNAIVSYIFSAAKEHKCYELLLHLLYERQFYLSKLALSSIGWRAKNIKLPPFEKDLQIEEAVFQFDNQKLALVCFFKIDLNRVDLAGISKQIEERNKEVVTYLSALNPNQEMKVFCISILPEINKDFLFTPIYADNGNQFLTIRYTDLWIITHSEKVDHLTLWKFAKCYNRTNELTKIVSLGGVLDLYAPYSLNNYSFFDSDKANPLNGVLLVLHNSGDDFKRTIIKYQNEHGVPLFYEGKLAFAITTRFKDYAPIYFASELSDEFRIVTESYKMPIWVVNRQSTYREENWSTYVSEAVVFWLYKMQAKLSPFFAELSFVSFEFEIIVDENLVNAGEFEIKAIDVDSIELSLNFKPGKIEVHIPFDYIYAVAKSDNSADKILMRSILTGLVMYVRNAGKEIQLDESIINQIVESVLQPTHAKMILFSDASRNVKMDDRKLPAMRYLQEADISYILDNLVNYLPTNYFIPEKITAISEKIQLCDDIVTALILRLEIKIKQFEGVGLIKWLVKYNEKSIQIKEYREIVIPAKIACFSNLDKEIEELLDEEKDPVKTGHALRTLIEFVAVKFPNGQKWANIDDIDELLALTNQITEWGALSESIRLGIDNPDMGLLPSRRIGTEKTFEHDALKPFQAAKVEGDVYTNIEKFESNYLSAIYEEQVEKPLEVKALDVAFKTEFGISLTMLGKIIGELMRVGFSSAKSCIEITETKIIDSLREIVEITEDDITVSLAMLTLIERPAIGLPPLGGYTSKDIFPWRYNRSLSFLRRPIIKFITNGEVTYCYGYRHLIVYFDHLVYLLYTSKLPNPVTSEMKSWLANVSGGKGNPFREKVKEWLIKETNLEVIPYEVQMDKYVKIGHIRADRHYGDIDILAIDHKDRIFYSIECKNITGARNIHEMKVEIDEYLGREGYDKKAKMKKHVQRDAWLQENKSSLVYFADNAEQYRVVSIILTVQEIPLSYIKREQLPLPIKAFTTLRQKGVSYLVSDI